MAGGWKPAKWPEREIAWIIWPDEAGHGYALEATHAVRSISTTTCGWDGAVSYIDPKNLDSIRLAERLGANKDHDAADDRRQRRGLPPPLAQRAAITPDWPMASRWKSAITPTRCSNRKDGPLTDTDPHRRRRAAELLKEHRASIDRLDAILVYTLGERFKHTQAVGQLKAEHDLPPSDPAREAQQIARLEDLAQRGRSRPRIRQEVPELHHR